MSMRRVNGGESKFRHNFFKMAKANVIINVLPLIFTPILTRLYSPEDFGAFAIFGASLSMLCAFSTWKFDWLIPGATSTKKASMLFYLGVVATLFFCVVIYPLALFFQSSSFFIESFGGVGRFLWLLPFAVLANNLIILFQSLYIYMEDLSDVSKVKVTQGLFLSSSNVFAGALGFGLSGLIMTSVLASWLGFILLLSRAKTILLPFKKMKISNLLLIFYKSFGDASVSTLVSIVSAANIVVIPFMLAYLYSPSEVGWYALMYRVVIGTISILGSALSQSFWAEAKSLVLFDKAELHRLYLKITKILLWVSIPIVIICITAPFYVAVIFGRDEWGEAGYILAALTPLVIGSLVVQPLTHLIVHKKQHWKLYLDIMKLFLMVLIVPVLGLQGASINTVVFALSVVVFVSYMVLFYLNNLCLQR